ncbi:hypothetical protein LEP1GSC058_3823 [Leptospira fainei serovar Hurstbridge str. BUT 6]|uniref:Uncharacterized protein n=1 Tax=Leptospira fainei serovar Hurstbridge str. BUT 6 TaxID=1193011 RepID=S3VAY3_9LEPT|nr:hypothetical protein LEP1GSC058_3823 [Leptospira fainei serovar Hurstbridge str. BUT 6]
MDSDDRAVVRISGYRIISNELYKRRNAVSNLDIFQSYLTEHPYG